MCGRYVVAYDPQELVDGFSLVRVAPFPRRWNVAPTSMVPVVYETREGERVGELMRWGLVPHWARDPSGGAKLNNARAEGIGDKPSFRQAVRKRRCLIPASGYYEWQVRTGPDGKPFKQPWYISPADGAPFFAFAGLFEAWRPPGSTADGDWLLTCSIVTIAPCPAIAHVHDRMPVIVPKEDWAAWLARDQADPAHWGALLRTADDTRVRAWPVDRAVGRSTEEGERLVAPLEGDWGEGCGASVTPMEDVAPGTASDGPR